MTEYDHTIYVVIPLGDVDEGALDEDAEHTLRYVAPFKAHAVTDPEVCDQITEHLLSAPEATDA